MTAQAGESVHLKQLKRELDDVRKAVKAGSISLPEGRGAAFAAYRAACAKCDRSSLRDAFSPHLGWLAGGPEATEAGLKAVLDRYRRAARPRRGSVDGKGNG